MPVIGTDPASLFVCRLLKQFFICMPVIITGLLYYWNCSSLFVCGYWNKSSLFVCLLLELFLFICMHVIGTASLSLYAGYRNIRLFFCMPVVGSVPLYLYAGYWNGFSFFV